MRYYIGIEYQYVSRAMCAYAQVMFFGNDRGVRLLEHVHLLRLLFHRIYGCSINRQLVLSLNQLSSDICPS